MTSILGISAFYHDSAAALVSDGNIVAAAQEERFTRKKHDPGFPAQAIAYCLQEAGLGLDQVDYIAFYDKPLTKFERLLETYFAYAPSGFRSFCMAMPLWLKDKLHMRRTLRRALGDVRARPIGDANELPSDVSSVVVVDRGEEHNVPVTDGYFLYAAWKKDTPGDSTTDPPAPEIVRLVRRAT